MSKIKATDAAILSEKLDLAVFDYGIPLFFNEAEGELVAKISSNYSFVIEKNNNIIISSTLKNQRRISIECLHPGKYKVSYRRPTDEPREWRRDTVSGENNINGLISELAKE